MKTRQEITRILLMVVLLLTATGLRASDLVSKISNATVKWYSDVNKNTEITSVTLTTSPQTVYLDIQPASGYWTSETDLNGEVEKFASIGAAGTRASGPTFPEKSKVTKVNGQTYAPNGAGVYQVILPALASGQVASDIEKLVLTGTVNECTSISGATVDNDPDYNGGAQSAVIKLGTTTLTKGTDYEVAAGSSDSRTGAGTTTFTINGIGKYKGSVTGLQFTVNQKEVGLTWGSTTSWTYDGQSHAPTVEASGLVTVNGVKDACNLTVELSAKTGSSLTNGEAVNVGEYTSTVKGLDNNNYKLPASGLTKDFSIVGNSSDEIVVTITGHFNASPYDGKEHSVSGYDVSISNPLYTERDFTFNGKAETKRTDAGTTNMGLTVDQFVSTNPNYANVIFNVKDGYQTIVPVSLTVTANDNTIAYGEAAANAGVTYSGLVNNEDESVLGGELKYSYNAQENGQGDPYTTASPVGTYYIIPSGLTSTNYNITFKAGKLTVSQNPIVIGGDDDTNATATMVVSPTEFTYNGQDQKPSVKVVMKADGKEIDSKEYDVKYRKGNTEVTETKDAATYTVVITNKAGADYAFSGTTTADFVIKPAPLTITANDKTIAYGEAAANAGVTYSGLVNNEKESVLGGELKYSYNAQENGQGDPYTTASPVGTYYIIPSGLTSTNYDITFKAGKLTVSQNPIVIGGDDDANATAKIVVSPTEFTYNGTDQKPSVKVVMKADGKEIDSKEYDVKYRKGNTEVTETKDAATYTVVITNKTGSDYTFSGTTTADFVIKPALLTITANDKTIAYGEAAANDGVTYSGLVNNEKESVLGGELKYSYNAQENGQGDPYTTASPMGTYYIIPAGLTSTNYDITFQAGKLTVSQNPIVIGGDDDANATATMVVSPTEFTYNGQDQKPSVKVVMKADGKEIASKEYDVKYRKGNTEVTDTKDAGTYTVVITNKAGADYAFSGTTTADFVIKPAPLTITAEAKTKVEGEADPELTYKAEGLVEGDAITGALTRKTGEDVGEYDITQGTLSAGDNYTITFIGAKLIIKAKEKEPEPEPTPPVVTTYKVIVAPSTGGEVKTTVVDGVVPGTQVNLIVEPDEGYHLATLKVTMSGNVTIDLRTAEDKDGAIYPCFMMPASDVYVTATFEKTEKDQNIFIWKAKYGEIISHVLHADPNQQVNLRALLGEDSELDLDKLAVVNNKGERLRIYTIMDPTEGLIYFFFMSGESVQIYNSFKGTNNTVDESNPLPPDNLLYLLNSDYLSFLNLSDGAEGVQIAMSLVANILAKFTPEGELKVRQGEDDLILALLNLKSGWQIKLDFTGDIKVLLPGLLEGVGADGTIKTGVLYKMLSDGKLELLLKSSLLPQLIKSITVIAPEPEQDPEPEPEPPTAISSLQADDAAADIYDLSGRKVDPTSLRKGMYIRDGKVVVIK